MEIGNSISVCICTLGVLFLWFSIDTVTATEILVKISNTTSGFQFSVNESRILPRKKTFGNLPGISNIVYLWNDEYVYLKEKKIYRGTLTKNLSISATLLFDFGKITRISVDRQHENVYFYEETLKMIGVTPLNSSSGDLIYRVIASQIEKSENFAVDPFNRVIFWVENDKRPFIYRCNLKGEEKRILHYQGLFDPRSLTINFEEQILYWYDAILKTLEKSDIDGDSRERLVHLDFDISILGFLKANLMVMMNTSTILTWDLDRETVVDILNFSNIEDITIINRTFDAGPCLGLKCSQFCFPRYKDVNCECLDGFTLDLNGRDCTRSLGVMDEGLSVVKDGRFCYALTDVALGNNRTFRCSDDLLNVISIEFEEERDKIIYLQRINNTFEIGTMELGLWKRKILYTSQTEIKGVSYDATGNYKAIFFFSHDSIKRYDFKETAIIHKEKNLILSIAIEARMKKWHRRRIAWVTAENYFIKISYLDGSGKRTLVKALGIRNIFFSPYMERLFWTSYEGIMSIDKDGENEQVNRYVAGATFDSLLHYQNLLIWSMSTAKENFICSSEYGNGVGAKERCVLLEGKITDIVINDRLLSPENNSSFCSNGCRQMCLKYPIYGRYGEIKCGCEFGLRDNGCFREVFLIQFVLLDKTGNSVFGFSEGNKYSKITDDDKILDISIKEPNLIYVATNRYVRGYFTDDDDYKPELYDFRYRIRLFCFDSSSNSLIIIGLTDEGYSLYQAYVYSTMKFKVHLKDIQLPTEIACIARKRIAVISTGNALVVYDIENSTLTVLQTPYQEAHIRLAAHQPGNDIYGAETNKGEIFRLSLDGKSLSKIYEAKKGEITDFDVGDKYIYILTKYQRQILIIRKSNGTLYRTIKISPLIGHLSKIIYVPANTDDIGETTGETTVQKTDDDGENSASWVSIPIIFVIILIVIGLVFWKKRRNRRQAAEPEILELRSPP